jgi:hypothetical protein
MPLIFDSSIVLLIPALLLAFYAQWKVRSTFNKYSKVNASSRISAGLMARYLLQKSGLTDVKIEKIGGFLSDHYDPRSKILRISNLESKSVAALGVAAHEVGHAIQHAQGYKPLSLRSAVVPVANFGSMLAFPLFFLGLLARNPNMMWLGILAFSAAVLFTLVTLPVEFNASKRAIKILQDGGYITQDKELKAVKEVLNAAALTYVAAAAMAVLQLLRLILISRNR